MGKWGNQIGGYSMDMFGINFWILINQKTKEGLNVSYGIECLSEKHSYFQYLRMSSTGHVDFVIYSFKINFTIFIFYTYCALKFQYIYIYIYINLSVPYCVLKFQELTYCA